MSATAGTWLAGAEIAWPADRPEPAHRIATMLSLRLFSPPRFALGFAWPITLALLLGGCATTLRTEVTSFHQLSNGLEGQRFVITPSDEQKNSLEFGTYAEFVSQALRRKGLMEADSGSSAELGVAMQYSISAGGSTARGDTGGFAGFGVGSGGFSVGSVGIGVGFPLGSIGGGSSDSVVYQRTLRIEIDRLSGGADVKPAPGASDAATTRVFEARAISDGPSASLAPVIRAMVQAIFEEFPGPSGTTRVVEVPMDESM